MRTSKIQNGRQGIPKWPTGSGKGSNPRLLGALINFSKISFCDPNTPSMSKGDDGGEKREEKTRGGGETGKE